MRVSSCCCGCSLKTGTILIAVYYLIGYLLALLGFSALLALTVVAKDEDTSHFYNEIEAANKDSSLSRDDVKTVAKVSLGIAVAIFILAVLFTIVLLVGAIKEKPKLLYIWIVVHTILLVLQTIAVLIDAFGGNSKSESKGGSIAFAVINILLTVYFLVVVYSYYQELKEKENEPPGMRQRAAVLNMEGYPMPPANAPPSY